jgi:hypothetical protein
MRRVEPWNPAAAELATYAGRYYSAELETAYVVRADSSRLVAQHRRHGDIVLTPKDTDRFEGGAGYLRDVRFTRDAAGAINGMLVTTGRIRNLRFERQP